MTAIDDVRMELMKELIKIIEESPLSEDENTNIALNFCTNLIISTHARGRKINMSGAVKNFTELLEEKLQMLDAEKKINETSDLH